MATTNKHFDDKAILDRLRKSHGIDVSGATDVHVDLTYDAPVSNGEGRAQVRVDFYVWLTAAEADAALREGFESPSGG